MTTGISNNSNKKRAITHNDKTSKLFNNNNRDKNSNQFHPNDKKKGKQKQRKRKISNEFVRFILLRKWNLIRNEIKWNLCFLNLISFVFAELYVLKILIEELIITFIIVIIIIHLRIISILLSAHFFFYFALLFIYLCIEAKKKKKPIRISSCIIQKRWRRNQQNKEWNKKTRSKSKIVNKKK